MIFTLNFLLKHLKIIELCQKLTNKNKKIDLEGGFCSNEMNMTGKSIIKGKNSWIHISIISSWSPYKLVL